LKNASFKNGCESKNENENESETSGVKVNKEK